MRCASSKVVSKIHDVKLFMFHSLWKPTSVGISHVWADENDTVPPFSHFKSKTRQNASENLAVHLICGMPSLSR